MLSPKELKAMLSNKIALKFPVFNSYEEMLDNEKWQNALGSLNECLASSLLHQNAEPYINGNLFYEHKDPEFIAAPLVPRLEGKRQNLFKLAQAAQNMFEIGVNGGHSIFLALSANPSIKVVGIDICCPLEDSWARVDIYVPTAFQWLEQAFPGRFTHITGNSLLEIPRYVDANPDEKIDLLHLDGSKDTHLREFLAAEPLFTKNAWIILDDTNTKPVRNSMKQILSLRKARHAKREKLGLEVVFGHRILEANN